jgi:hypothetical protein
VLAAASLASFVTPVLAQEVTRTPLDTNHPLLGTWRIELPEQKCFEEYKINADGTKLSLSREERNESVFDISPEPTARGFYRWADKITKTNGRPDCGGSTTGLGHVAISFIKLHPNGKLFLLCEAEAMESCFAEFRRNSSAA